MANDFEVIGRIVVDSSGAVSIQAMNQQLEQMEQNSTSLASAFGGAGAAGAVAFGSLIAGAISSAASALANFTGAVIKSGLEDQRAMAQFDAVLKSTATSTKAVEAATGHWEKTTALTTAGVKKLENQLQSQNNAINDTILKAQIHGSMSKAAGEAIAFHQAKIAALNDELKKGAAVQEVWVNNTEESIPVTRMSRDALLQLADTLAKTTVNAQTTNIEAETMMLQFTNIGANVFPRAMQAAADLSARLGTDLPNAGMIIGRALDKPAEGVGRLNMQLKLFEPTQLKAIENMAKQGKVTEAQTLILDALSAKLGGAATAAASTFEGHMQILQNRLMGFTDQIMAAILPGLGKMLDGLNPLLDQLPAIADVITTRVIPVLAQFFHDLGDGTTTIGNFVSSVTKPFKDLWNEIQPALMQLQTGVTKFMDKLFQPDTPRQTVKIDADTQVKPGQRQVDRGDGGQVDVKQAVKPKDIATKFQEAIQAATPDIEAAFGSMLTAVGSWLAASGYNLLKGGIQATIDLIKGTMGTGGTAAGNRFAQNAADAAGKPPAKPADFGETVGQWGNKIIAALYDLKADQLGQAIVDWVFKAWNNIKSTVSSVGNNLVNAISQGAFGNDGIFTTLAAQLSNAVSGLWGKVVDFIDTGKAIIANIVSGIAADAGNVLSGITDQVHDWIEGAKKKFTDFTQAGAAIVKGLIDGINAGKQLVINTLVAMAQDAIANTLAIFGIHSPSKVFAEIGKQLPAGVAEGIRQGAPHPAVAIQSMTERMMQGPTYKSTSSNVYNYHFGMNIYGGQQSAVQGAAQVFRK